MHQPRVLLSFIFVLFQFFFSKIRTRIVGVEDENSDQHNRGPYTPFFVSFEYYTLPTQWRLKSWRKN